MPVNELRWGLVGLGSLANTGLAQAFKRSKCARLVAVSTRERSKAEAFAERFGGLAVHDDFSSLVQDPNVDAIFVATPNRMHAPVVHEAARAGKHVLCEKPLSLDVGEGRAMVAVCSAAGVMLRVGLHLRAERFFDRLGEVLRSGEIGTIRTLSIERAAPLAERTAWRDDPLQGGSVLYDVGVHLLDLVPRLIGASITSVAGLATPSPDSGAAADTITLLLRLADGVQATVRVSREAPHSGADLVALGTKGMLRTGPLRWVPNYTITTTTASGTRVETMPASDIYREEIEAFGEDLRDGGCRLATGEEGVRLISIVDAVQTALRQRRFVELR